MATLENIINLTKSYFEGSVSKFSKDGMELASDAVRQGILDFTKTDKLTPSVFRDNKNMFFKITEEMIETALPLAWEQSPFYQQFVDVRNVQLGDSINFVVEDRSVLVASRFSGNHWNTKRQKLQGSETFTIPTEWIVIRAYNDWEKFLKGSCTLDGLKRKLEEGFKNEIDGRIFTAFDSIGTYLPSTYTETGVYDKETMLELIQNVSVESGKDVILAGTKVALAKLTNEVGTVIVSDRQKEEIATNGVLKDLTGLGVNAIEIPQSFVRNTRNPKVSNNVIYVIPKDEKFIKLVFEGQTYGKEMDQNENMDMTFDVQFQTKLGVGVVVSSVMGKYQLA